MLNKGNFFNVNNYIGLSIILLFPILFILGPASLELFTILLIILFLTNLWLKKERIFYDNELIIIFLILCLYFILISIFAVDKYLSFSRALFYFRYGLLSLAVSYFLFKNLKYFNLIRLTYFIIFLFVLLDTLYQFFNYEDIFGFKHSASGRLSGPFGSYDTESAEFIVGGYLLKFYVLLTSLYFSIFKFKNLKKILFFYFISILTLFTILLTTERISTIFMIFYLIIFLFFIFKFLNKIEIKKNFLILVFLILFLFSSIFISQNLFSFNTPTTIKKNDFIQNNIGRTIDEINNFRNTSYGIYFLTGFEMFKNSPLIGHGLKNYRVECKNKIYSNIVSKQTENRCNTHPHNIHVEVLSETGLLGYLILLYLFTKIIDLKKIFLSKKIDMSAPLCIYFLIYFVPFMTMNSFFSNYSAIFFWYILGFYIFSKNSNKNFYHKKL